MTWLEDMKRDAAKIATVGIDFELRPNDEVHFEFDWEQSRGVEIGHFEPNRFWFAVVIQREGIRQFIRIFYDDQAVRFWTLLMQMGSEHD